MTATDLWQGIGAGGNMFTRFFRLVFLLAAMAALYFLATLPLTWQQQTVCGLLMLVMALLVGRNSDSYLITLTLMLMSIFSTFRYGYWRVLQTVRYFENPVDHRGVLDAVFVVSLLAAEIYAVVILYLGYFQTVWPLRRAPVPLPEDVERWPHIDVLIPTCNEPLDVVRYTVLGALNMDWPADRVHVYILDDGRRKEFAEFAREAGVGYKTRIGNRHAKAGNINAALHTLHSPYVAIFDCDHVPTRSFLQMTMGWFLRDRKLAMLQTPHHFYSPDPFERNLGQFRVIPNEGELFYGIVQDGNDFWNATFFCGSCAVLRRAALDEIGGIAVETVTEDAHTSLRMQIKGWSTAYINIPQAAGLAAERLSEHVGQRIRWARGMIQILRHDNPIFASGLKLPQRICYFNAILHFFYAAPRLIFLIAPLIFLLFSRTCMPGYWAAILAYALPHLVLSNLANSRIQGEHRHSFWNEIYETVLSPYILLPTIAALISSRPGDFNVTAKGGVVNRTFFDTRMAQPFLMMLLLNLAGVAMAVPRLLWWDHDRPGTVMMNLVWACFNVVILGVCTGVAREMKQVRTSVRIDIATPVTVKLADGRTLTAETTDMSSGGICMRMPEPFETQTEGQVRLSFPPPVAHMELPAKVVSTEGRLLRVRFDDLTIAEQEALTMALYSRADSWLGWGESRENDNVLRSLARIFTISMHGLAVTTRSLFTFRKSPGQRSEALPAVNTLLVLTVGLLLAGAVHPVFARPQGSPKAVQTRVVDTSAASAPAQFHDSFTLADAGLPQIELRGIDSSRSIHFTLPQNHTPRSAKIHLHYAFSSGLLQQFSHLKLMMNGTLFATVQPTPGQTGGSASQMGEGEFAIPPELLKHNNTLTIQSIAHYTTTCEDPANTTLWSNVYGNSFLDIQSDLAPLADDIKQLPLPFLEPGAIQPLSIPVVFASMPSYKAIQAAGALTSYFGMIAENRPVRFPVQIGALPAGNVIVISDAAANLPPGLNLSPVSVPTVAIRTNPNDPGGKVLVIAGADSDQALRAAQAVALQTDLLQGPQAPINDLKLPEKQNPDEAPRWARTDRPIELTTADQLQGDGSEPLKASFRLPPDLFYGDRIEAKLRLAYRYNSMPLGPSSSLQVRMNDAFLGSLPLIPGQAASRNIETDVPVSVANLRPFSNSLDFDFAFQLRKKDCRDTAPANMQGAILRNSSLDLRGFPHYAPLPNLATFANAGFPFTRLADLAGTTVVLPPSPSPQEIETFLTLMGHFSRQTGYPALRVAVAGAEALRAGATTDFLILGTGDDQPAFDKLAGKLPVALRTGQVQVHDTQGFLAPLVRSSWWNLEPNQRVESGSLTAGGEPDSVIEGFESPFAQGRSIVAIHFRDAASFEPFMTNFLRVEQSSDIAGSVSILRGAEFHSYRVGSEIYHVGELPPLARLRLWLMDYPYLPPIIVLGLSLLLAAWTRQWLRNKARARLRILQD